MSADGRRTGEAGGRNANHRPSGSTWRSVLLAVVVISALVLGGCLGTREYSTSIGDPTTGEVIENVSVYKVNPIEGARLTVHHSIDPTDTRSYSLGVYERENGSLEPHKFQSFDDNANTTGVTLLIPSRDETVAEQQIRAIHRENETVVDAINVTVSGE